MYSLIFLIVIIYVVMGAVSSAKNDEKRKKEEIEEKRRNYQRAIDMHRYERGELDWQKEQRQEKIQTPSYSVSDDNIDEPNLFNNKNNDLTITPMQLSDYTIPTLDILQDSQRYDSFQSQVETESVSEIENDTAITDKKKNTEPTTLKDDFFAEYGIEDLKIGI